MELGIALAGGGGAPLYSGFNSFIFMIGLEIVCTLLQNPIFRIPLMILWWGVGHGCLTFKDAGLVKCWKVMPIFCILIGTPYLIPALCVIFMLYDQGRVESEVIADGLEWMIKVVRMDWYNDSIHAYFGSNSDFPVVDSIRGLVTDVEVVWNAIIGDQGIGITPVVYGTRLRDNGVADYVQEGPDGVPLSPCEILELERKTVKRNKFTVIGCLGLVAMVLSVHAIGTAIFAIVMCTLIWDEATVDLRSAEKRGGPIPDGTYSLEKRWLGVAINRCIGVSYQGVMHAPYHGVSKCDLRLGGQRHHAYFASVHTDLTTWGGLPKFSRIDDEDVLIANRETAGGRKSYMINPTYDTGYKSFSWIGVSEPGESGSPIWKRTNEGGLMLVGMIGRWTSMNGIVTEVMILPDVAADFEMEDDGKIIRVHSHPGSGKTRTMIPTLVGEHLSDGKNKRRPKIVILGPTRVVAKEIYNGLRNRWGGTVGLSMKGHNTERNVHARVQVTTHHTCWSMIETGALEILGATMYIIDEAHYNDVATKVLLKYMEGLAEEGVKVVLMSATLPNRPPNDKSNYPIRDVKIKEGSEKDVVMAEVEAGNKVVWFVKGYEGPDGAKNLASQFKKKGVECIALSRHTFADVHHELTNPDVRLIVSTNIAECGINLDADVVVDSCENFEYTWDGGVVTGLTRTIDNASRTQRRGRVGRKKAGTYYYTRTPQENANERVSDFETRLIVAGRQYGGGEAEMGLYLSDSQVKAIVRDDKNALYVASFTGRDGEKLSGDALQVAIKKWLSGDVYFEGCGKCKDCEGNYTWFDMRIHDALVDLKCGRKRGSNLRNAIE